MDAAGHGDRQAKSSIILRLLDHAEHNWPQLTKVQASYHDSFAYITDVLPGSEQIPLFRLRYGGSARSFGFAIYSPARDRYQDAILLTGLPTRSRNKHSTPPVPSTSQRSDTDPNLNPRRNYGVTHLGGLLGCLPSSMAINDSICIIRPARHNNTFGRADLQARCAQACR